MRSAAGYVAVAAVLCLSGCGGGLGSPVERHARNRASGTAPGPVTPDPRDAPGGSALAALQRLPVRPMTSKLGYSRAQFGRPYADTNHDGCDSRNQTAQRDLRGIVVKPGSRGCAVMSGMLDDPYSGAKGIVYSKGKRSPVQFEHVVALENAWRTGAQLLRPDQREQLANDPLEVLLVSAKANATKRANDASGWLPPNHAYRCTYVARQVAVKARYGLWVTPAERNAIASVLSACPGLMLPTENQVSFPVLRHPRVGR